MDENKSGSPWWCPASSPLLRKCLPLTSSQLSGCDSGSELIRDAKSDLFSERVSAHSPCNYAWAVLKGAGWGHTIHSNAQLGRQIPLLSKNKSEEDSRTGELAFCCTALLPIYEVWTGPESAAVAGPSTSRCILARSLQ